MKTFTRSILAALAGVLGIAVPSAASAQVVHVDNPFVGATMYRDPDYAAKVQTSIDQVTDASLRTKMQAVKQTPTAVWLDRIAAIAGGATAAGLEEHLDNALAQRQGNTPIVALFVIYDLPGRDCSALASNGELPLSAAGFARYRTEYIDVIAEIMGRPEYQGIRIATVIEPDGLPNLVTNLSDPECAEANRTGLYVQAVQYALNKLHAIPNVYTYLDIAHSGWLGWPNNASGAVSVYTQMVNGTTARFASVDGFVTNTANTLPLREPFLNASQNIGGQQLISGRFFEFNPNIDEISFTADLYSRFTAAGWPASIGFLIDTSRNGWGGAARPTGPGTSTDLNTFINQSKIDRRQHRGLWCNQAGSGLGAPPQAAPAGFPASHLDAFVWVKPPGDSDGSSRLIPNDEGKGFDRFCDPTFMTPLGTLSNALPDAPISGAFFHNQFVQLVQNAFPVPGGGPACAIAPPAPTTFTATAISATQVNLAWSNVAAPAGCSVSFNVYRGTTATFTPSAANRIASALTGTTFADVGATPATTLFYVVESVDEAGQAIARASATTPPGGGGCAVAPAAVTNLVAAASGSSQILLSWNAVAAPANCAVTYTVHRSTTANFTPSPATQVATGLTATSHLSAGLAAATTFHFVVLAVDAAGASAVVRATAATGPIVGGGGGCRVVETVVNSWPGGYQAALSIQNTGTTPISGWTLTWTFPGTQRIASLWNGAATQSGATVTVNSLSHNATIAPGASYNDAGFVADGTVGIPANFAINGVPCN